MITLNMVAHKVDSAMHRLISLILLTTIISACENAPRVEIDNQTLIGKYSQNKKIASFLGIPFAEAPVGKLRWADPFHINRKILKGWRLISPLPVCSIWVF